MLRFASLRLTGCLLAILLLTIGGVGYGVPGTTSTANAASATSAIPDIFFLPCDCDADTEDSWSVGPALWVLVSDNILTTSGVCTDRVILTNPSEPPDIFGCEQESGCHFGGTVVFNDYIMQATVTCTFDAFRDCGVTFSLTCSQLGNTARQGASCAKCASLTG